MAGNAILETKSTYMSNVDHLQLFNIGNSCQQYCVLDQMITNI